MAYFLRQYSNSGVSAIVGANQAKISYASGSILETTTTVKAVIVAIQEMSMPLICANDHETLERCEVHQYFI